MAKILCSFRFSSSTIRKLSLIRMDMLHDTFGEKIQGEITRVTATSLLEGLIDCMYSNMSEQAIKAARRRLLRSIKA